MFTLQIKEYNIFLYVQLISKSQLKFPINNYDIKICKIEYLERVLYEGSVSCPNVQPAPPPRRKKATIYCYMIGELLVVVM